MPLEVDASLARRLHRRAHADRWDLPTERFAQSLATSAGRAFAGASPTSIDVERYLEALHLEDLALATACVLGHEGAWQHFIEQHRPILYRAAQAIDPGGGARELADSLYADLFGLEERDGVRQSLFRYFHGRSSLATWLRAVLAQRHVDRLRADRRTEPLPDEESAAAIARSPDSPDLDRSRSVTLIGRALDRALGRLAPRDRLRLACYYAQDLTLAEIGRLMREHESTVSRHLEKARRAVRADMLHQLRAEAQLDEDEIRRCFECAIADPGPMNVARMLAAGGKKIE
jgi:RNA polymerase sigma-70 factor, ECF subfamily